MLCENDCGYNFYLRDGRLPRPAGAGGLARPARGARGLLRLHRGHREHAAQPGQRHPQEPAEGKADNIRSRRTLILTKPAFISKDMIGVK